MNNDFLTFEFEPIELQGNGMQGNGNTCLDEELNFEIYLLDFGI